MLGHSLGKATPPWMRQWDSTWIHLWDCPPAPSTYMHTGGQPWGMRGHLCTVPSG